MTNDVRVKAFTLRLAGLTWDQIAEEVGYSTSTVEEDLYNCLHRPVACCPVISSPLRRYIMLRCNGSVSEFQRLTGLQTSRLRPMLRGAAPFDPAIVAAICEQTGLLQREVLQRE